MNEQPVILYGISKVHYDKTHTIDRVMVHEIKGGTVRPGREWSRAEVVSRILKLRKQPRPAVIVTLPKGKFGQTVEVLREKIIRSIPNGSANDNLARLPRILTSYGISKVRYNCAHTHIESVMVHKVQCQKICCDGCEWRRLDVVDRIKEGDSFVTLPRLKDGTAESGRTVEVWHKKFIRTTPSGEYPDNLEDLDQDLSTYGISKEKRASTHVPFRRMMVHKVERRLHPAIPVVRNRRAGITTGCDGCEWREKDVVHREKVGDSFV